MLLSRQWGVLCVPTMRNISFKGLSVLRHLRKKQKAYAILAYHQIIDPKGTPLINANDLCVQADAFHRQMEYISQLNMEMSLEEMVHRITEGIPPRKFSVAITFDDGHLSNVECALPILKKFDLGATFFITTDFAAQTAVPWWDKWRYRISRINKAISWELSACDLGDYNLCDNNEKKRLFSDLKVILRRNPNMVDEIDAYLTQISGVDSMPRSYMNWEEVRWLSRQRKVAIGAHSVSHARSDQSKSLFSEEIMPSKRVLEEKLGQPIRLYSYPFGTRQELGPAICGDAEKAGFLGAVTALEGFNDPITQNPFLLKRIPVVGEETFGRFLGRLYMADAIGKLKGVS